MSDLNWTQEQIQLVSNLIAEEVEIARLSHKLIPEVTVAGDTRSVPADEFDPGANRVDDVKTIPLVEVSASFNLTKLQAEDSDLWAARLLVRRAANRIARTHDLIVFRGQPDPDQLQPRAPLNVAALGGYKNDGVAAAPASVDVDPRGGGGGSYGERLVAAVADALVQLEGQGYSGSYVLVLGQQLFIDANTPSRGSLVLPNDRLGTLLAGGPVHRSSVLDQDQGLLLSLSGEAIDRVVATAPTFEFLRIGANEVRECRVFERFTLRLKEKESVIKLVRK